MTVTQILRQDQTITAFHGGDANLPGKRIGNLDTLYRDVTTALDNLVDAVGLKAA